MKRDLTNELIRWKQDPHRKPLILRGARQVGKTYLLKDFGKQYFKNTVYLNFEEDQSVHTLFKTKLSASSILNDLRLYTDSPISANDTLIIFDEIQECQQALNSLKYFYEQAPEYALVSAGSLLGLKLGSSRSFPVGKIDFLDLQPLSFFEFLDAADKGGLRQYLESLVTLEPLSEPIHEKLLDLLKKYYFTGGMPGVLRKYFEALDAPFTVARKEQKALLEGYSFDFAKYSEKYQALKILQIWESIPSQLAKENKKFILSNLQSGARLREYENAIQWLIDAGLVLKVRNLQSPQLPLVATMKETIFKLYLLDIGLLGAMMNLEATTLLNGNEYFSSYKGAFTENYVLQQLWLQHKQHIAYWTSPYGAEVDFVVEVKNNIYPLEVKSGSNKKKKSLTSYIQQFKPETAYRGSTRNLKKDAHICNLPLYLLPRFPL